MMRLCAILFLAAAGWAVPLSAEVFSLWPFSSGDGGGSLEDALKPSRLWSEKVVVDGHSLELGVSLVQNPLDVCYKNLRKLYPDARFAANSNSLLVEIKRKNGIRRRLYLLAIEGIYPTIEFTMDLPAEKLKPSHWPADFPLPPGSKPIAVMEFPKRNAVYGAFSSEFGISQTLPSVAAALKNAGWNSITNEHKDAFNGTGEVLMKQNPPSLIIIGFSPTKNGGCIGTIYKRRNQ